MAYRFVLVLALAALCAPSLGAPSQGPFPGDNCVLTPDDTCDPTATRLTCQTADPNKDTCQCEAYYVFNYYTGECEPDKGLNAMVVCDDGTTVPCGANAQCFGDATSKKCFCKPGFQLIDGICLKQKDEPCTPGGTGLEHNECWNEKTFMTCNGAGADAKCGCGSGQSIDPLTGACLLENKATCDPADPKPIWQPMCEGGAFSQCVAATPPGTGACDCQTPPGTSKMTFDPETKTCVRVKGDVCNVGAEDKCKLKSQDHLECVPGDTPTVGTCQCASGFLEDVKDGGVCKVSNDQACEKNSDCLEDFVCGPLDKCECPSGEVVEGKCGCESGRELWSYPGKPLKCLTTTAACTDDSCDPNALCLPNAVAADRRCNCTDPGASNIGGFCFFKFGAAVSYTDPEKIATACTPTLSVIGGKCDCEATHFYDAATERCIVIPGSATDCKNNNANCDSMVAECLEDAGTSTYKCQCQTGYEIDEGRCRGGLSRACSHDDHCKTSQLLSCHSDTKTCQCKDNTYTYIADMCYVRAGQACMYEGDDCEPDFMCWAGEHGNSTTEAGTCVCLEVDGNKNPLCGAKPEVPGTPGPDPEQCDKGQYWDDGKCIVRAGQECDAQDQTVSCEPDFKCAQLGSSNYCVCDVEGENPNTNILCSGSSAPSGVFALVTILLSVVAASYLK